MAFLFASSDRLRSSRRSLSAAGDTEGIGVCVVPATSLAADRILPRLLENGQRPLSPRCRQPVLPRTGLQFVYRELGPVRCRTAAQHHLAVGIQPISRICPPSSSTALQPNPGRTLESPTGNLAVAGPKLHLAAGARIFLSPASGSRRRRFGPMSSLLRKLTKPGSRSRVGARLRGASSAGRCERSRCRHRS
jgi:hypothetical protein